VYVADLVFNSAGDITGIKNERQITDNAAVNFGPFWHPDRRHIIWANSLNGQSNLELYLMRADGSHKTRITFSQGADLLPAFSPDGKWLMWTSMRGPEKTTQVWVAPFMFPKGS
jgi:Tol biopolymer transport system component